MDARILAQSQLERAIEMCALVGFSDELTTPNEKVDFIVNKLTPYLMRKTLKNSEDLLTENKKGD